MFAHIDISKNVSGVLRYHEKKVQQGKAQLIDGNTAKDVCEMTGRDKLYHFQRRNSLNEMVVQNTMHVVLSWPAGDDVDNNRMRTVARDYLKEMGWEDQPYLVYRHNDRAHPHLHIVCTNVTRQGERIKLQRHDYFRTHELVERLDQRYLERLKDRLCQQENVLEPRSRRTDVTEGPKSLLPRLSAALDEVVPTYKYTTLTELNAVLVKYQLKASRGQQDSLTYQNGGLVFVALTADGKEAGPYIKASVLDSQPTLKHLEERFKENGKDREDEAQRVRTAIDWAFFVQSPDIEGLRNILLRDSIRTVTQQDNRGKLIGICYIDERYRTVFEGSSLGEPYSAAAIEQRCEKAMAERQEKTLRNTQEQVPRLRIY